MNKRNVMLGIFAAIVIICVVAFIVIFVVQLNSSNPINETLNAQKNSIIGSVQLEVDIYIATITSKNKNKIEPIITGGSISKGSAYAMSGSKKYIIDATALKITLPKGEWLIDSSGKVSVK
jgi:hypothetical protein